MIIKVDLASERVTSARKPTTELNSKDTIVNNKYFKLSKDEARPLKKIRKTLTMFKPVVPSRPLYRCVCFFNLRTNCKIRETTKKTFDKFAAVCSPLGIYIIKSKIVGSCTAM